MYLINYLPCRLYVFVEEIIMFDRKGNTTLDTVQNVYFTAYLHIIRQ